MERDSSLGQLQLKALTFADFTKSREYMKML